MGPPRTPGHPLPPGISRTRAPRGTPSGLALDRAPGAGPGGLADLLGHDPAGTESVAVDGKTARGSRTETAPAAHLLSAVTAAGRTVSQLRVPDKTNEITAFTALLAPFDLTGAVVTADALHTQREHAKWLVERKNAHYLMVGKGNQPKLHAALKALPWKEVTARRSDREAGHGRRETRSVRTVTVTGLDFPYLVQAVKIHRHRTDLKTGKVTRQTVHAITDMTSSEASPQLIGRIDSERSPTRRSPGDSTYSDCP
ncbi:ISAs1 family transposase [Streptomyces sp. NPDC060031]|uniref:ISAs1 family transposase n=1 Tax=Streptomyces sp. NPDC060031 TaxID=3347043 RepID=UPI00367BCBE9